MPRDRSASGRAAACYTSSSGCRGRRNEALWNRNHGTHGVVSCCPCIIHVLIRCSCGREVHFQLPSHGPRHRCRGAWLAPGATLLPVTFGHPTGQGPRSTHYSCSQTARPRLRRCAMWTNLNLVINEGSLPVWAVVIFVGHHTRCSCMQALASTP